MDLTANADEKIQEANNILNSLSDVSIDGVSKLRNKIKQEISFLEKCKNGGALKVEQLACLNLTHLQAVTFKVLQLQDECTAVMCNKVLKHRDGSARKICIDLVLKGGSVWMKVIARNQKAITMLSKGECSYKQKSVIDQGVEFIECSKQNVCFYKPPKVIFHFSNGVDACVEKKLSKIGIYVESNTYRNTNHDQLFSNEHPSSSTNSKEYPIKDLKIIRNLSIIKQMPHMKLNLGVTTLIAYVSALTNGGCHYNFESDVLQKHAEWERIRPVKPILDSLFEGRELYCCSTAARIFKNILDTLGGEKERERGEKLLKELTIVDDVVTDKLKVGGNVKERSLAIFGTGEYLQAVTVTANHAFVRAATNQGIQFSVFLHESRALTEGKQLPP